MLGYQRSTWGGNPSDVYDTSPAASLSPNAGLTEMLGPAGYVTTAYDPVFKLSEDATRYVPAPSDVATILTEPGLPFSLVFRADPGREDVLLRIASSYEAASRRQIPPPAFGPLVMLGQRRAPTAKSRTGVARNAV